MADFQASSELLGIFLEDARAHLEALDHCLLSLERDGMVPAVAASVLGPLHTLKGNSGMMGFASVKDYVHRLEDVFTRLADGRLACTSDLFDRLFAGASALREAVEEAGRAGHEERDLGGARSALETLLAAPEAAPLQPAPRQAGPTAPVASDRRAAAEPPVGSSRAGALHYVAARSSTVRVDFARLDDLLNMVGELIIHRTKLEDTGRELAERLGDRDAARGLLEAVRHVETVSSHMQETVMDLRMLPIRHVFERFPRLVRDLAREQGKEIELILEGEDSRVDKAIIDEIGEPLVHMIRNAVDHGIERPAERKARGKTPTGTILLSASQESSHVLITIMDDGAGIDAAAVRRKAVARGLLRGEESVADRDLVQLVFTPGFSTTEQVSELSGRGVGLDVVLKSIERLNGLVEVETVPGVGTKFTIQLPLTLAIISALLLEVSGRVFAVPLGSVVESIRLDATAVHRVGGQDALRIRERIVPLLRLSDHFGLPAREHAERRYVVILGRGERRLGLVVDALKGQQEVVIKALDPAASTAASALAGATIMGDGRVVLILDVAALFESRRQSLLPRAAPVPAT
jgi:two-component system chemotaxis sensor kinase CheA